jgi:DNA-directed RNA polymerase specialized sigma24 family protein
VEDGLLVSRALSGDLDSFGNLYDRYFSRVYDFAWRTLRDDDAATAASERVFLDAMRRLPEGAKAPSLTWWLFGIAHAEVTRRAAEAPPAAAVYDEAFGTLGQADPAQLDDQGGDESAATAALVWEAATALGARDYALLDLHVRQDLDAAEIGPIAGMSRTSTETLLQRMRNAADDVMRDYVLARRYAGDCADLQSALAAAGFPPYSDVARDAVASHARGCDVCRDNAAGIEDPLAVFASLAPVAPPHAAKGDIWRALASAWPYRERKASAAWSPQVVGAGAVAAGGFDGGGVGTMPPAGIGGDGETTRNRIIMFGTAAVVLLIVAFAAGAIMSGLGDDGPGGSASARADGSPDASRTVGPPGVSVETPTAEPTETPDDEDSTPTSTPSPTSTPTEAVQVVPTNTPPPPEPPTATPPPVVDTPVPTPTEFSFD